MNLSICGVFVCEVPVCGVPVIQHFFFVDILGLFFIKEYLCGVFLPLRVEDAFFVGDIIFIRRLLKSGKFCKARIISESLHVQVAYNVVIYALTWNYCLLCA